MNKLVDKLQTCAILKARLQWSSFLKNCYLINSNRVVATIAIPRPASKASYKQAVCLLESVHRCCQVISVTWATTEQTADRALASQVSSFGKWRVLGLLQRLNMKCVQGSEHHLNLRDTQQMFLKSDELLIGKCGPQMTSAVLLCLYSPKAFVLELYLFTQTGIHEVWHRVLKTGAKREDDKSQGQLPLARFRQALKQGRDGIYTGQKVQAASCGMMKVF